MDVHVNLLEDAQVKVHVYAQVNVLVKVHVNVHMEVQFNVHGTVHVNVLVKVQANGGFLCKEDNNTAGRGIASSIAACGALLNLGAETYD